MIRRQVVIPASPGRVWEALTDPDLLRGWFGGEFEWDLREGAPLHFSGGEGGSRDGRVDEVRPESRLRFVWWPEGRPQEASEVSYLLEPSDDGVRLTVQERPMEEGPVDTPPDVPVARASSTGIPGHEDAPAWTSWDARLAGAWAGVAEAVRARA